MVSEPIPGLPESSAWERRWRRGWVAPLVLLPLALAVMTGLSAWFAVRGERDFPAIALVSFTGLLLTLGLIVYLARRPLPLRRALTERASEIVWVFVERTVARSGLRAAWCVYVGLADRRVLGLETPSESDAARAEAAIAALVPHASRGLTPERRAVFFTGDPATLRQDRYR